MMGQAAAKVDSDEFLEEIDVFFEVTVEEILRLEKQIDSMSRRIIQMHKISPQSFTDKAVDGYAVKIHLLRKLVQDTEVKVQLLSRAIGYGK
jgi:hypothetical protein